MKKYILLLFLLINNTIIANNNNTNISADVALKNILDRSINSMTVYKTENANINKDGVISVIKKDFLPFIDTKFSASQTLKNHWNSITKKQQENLEQYIINSLIKDYSNVLIGFDDFKNIDIEVDKNIKTKGNKAIVSVNFNTKEKNNPVLIAAKMIKTDKWKIYDVVFSGVSLIKNYSANFNSYIKRKGFDEFANKYLNQ